MNDNLGEWSGSDRDVRPRGVTRRPRPRTARSGTTLVELAVVIFVALVAASIYSRTLAVNARMRVAGRERMLAAEAARVALERMRSEEFSQLFARYNPDPHDDPGGPGTAPGNRFAVEGLTPLPDAPGGLVGEVVLPWAPSLLDKQAWILSEKVQDEVLGLPRDLNGDTLVDDLDHAGDYVILPVRVRIEWAGPAGRLTFELHTMLSEYQT